MAQIHILDKAVAELIAAGEVVERPASIVKELVENAVDAGADSITVEIEDGGISLIRIIDNGCGIPADELSKAFIRHATSKIQRAQDLESILTLGFRGEALASIAAMSRVELVTKPQDAQEGARCVAEGGEVGKVESAGCADGTCITVRDVFYNTPARMKFLKKNVSEAGAVAQVVEKCALSHPEIAFRFRRDGKITLQTSGNNDPKAVIYAVYGKEMAGNMIPVDYTADNGIRVYGHISSPEGVKPSRTWQSFFINGRYVRTRTAMAALEQAYKGKIMTGRFPTCVLHIQLNAHEVDVNVHPAKIEVRFADEKPVFSAVYFAVKSALAQLEQPLTTPIAPKPESVFTPESQKSMVQPQPPVERMTAQEFQVIFSEDQTSFSKPLTFSAPRSTAKLDIYVEDQDFYGNSTAFAKKHPVSEAILETDNLPVATQPVMTEELAIEMVPEVQQVFMEERPHYRMIGEAFETYILLESLDAFLLVDKHAAHERILYEELKKNIAYGNRQVLLSPQTVSLPQEDYASLLENLDIVESMGFLAEDFGPGMVVVREIPMEMGEKDIADILCEIADKLRRGLMDITPQALDRLYFSIACRSAIKAGDKNAPLELTAIVELLQENPHITHCPHGRPVWVKMSQLEIEKLFGRQG